MIVGIDHIELIVRDVREFVAFYEKMGGRRVRESEPSAIWNRTIPVMALTLE